MGSLQVIVIYLLVVGLLIIHSGPMYKCMYRNNKSTVQCQTKCTSSVLLCSKQTLCYKQPPRHLKYLGSKILLYDNAVCTFQLQLIVSGDISPNPGPELNVKSNQQTYVSTLEKQSITSYSCDRDTLLSLDTKCNIPRLPSNVWDTINDLRINSSSSTKRRGKRGGRRKSWLTNLNHNKSLTLFQSTPMITLRITNLIDDLHAEPVVCKPCLGSGMLVL